MRSHPSLNASQGGASSGQNQETPWPFPFPYSLKDAPAGAASSDAVALSYFMKAAKSLYLLTALTLAIAVWAYLTPVDVSIRAPGIVRPSSEVVRVVAEASGRIVRVSATEGGDVRRGDILLTLDPAAPILRRDSLREQIHFSELRLAELDSRIASLAAINATASSLDAAAHDDAIADARTRLTRAAQLFDSGLTSRQSLEDALLAVTRAEAASSTLALKRAQAGAQLEQIAAERTPLLAALSSAYRELSQTQLDLNRFTIAAPVDGRIVSSALLHAGETLAANAPIATLLPDSEPLVVESFVPSAGRQYVKPGQGVRLRQDSTLLDGTVTAIGPDVQIHDGVPVYRAAIAAEHLQLGATYDVHFITRRDRILMLLFQRIRREFDEAL